MQNSIWNTTKRDQRNTKEEEGVEKKIRSGRTEGGAYAAAAVAEEDAERREDDGGEYLEEEAASLRIHPYFRSGGTLRLLFGLVLREISANS